MVFRSLVHRSTLAALAIAVLIAVQPFGIFWHFVEDHLDVHSHVRGGIAIHGPDADPPHHEADHGHVWMMPAASVVSPQVSRPQPIAALTPFENVPRPSTAPFPPFAPPRA